MIVLASKRRGCGYDSAEKVTIEARLYLSRQYQTLVQKQAVIQGGPDDPDLLT
jgi:hypothetical protein